MTSILWERFEKNVANNNNKAAFFYLDEGIWKTATYHQLLDLVNRFARGLEACGVKTGMRAALMTPPSADFFALAFALLKMGIVPIIVDPAIGLKTVTECLKETKPDIFVGNSFTNILRVLLGWGRDSIKHNLTIEKIKNKRSKVLEDSCYEVEPSSPAAIIYTSGSTGLPKGVVYTQNNFTAQLDMLRETFQIQPYEIDLPAFPLYVIIDILLGVTSVIPDIRFPVPGKTDPKKVFNAVEQFNVTNMFASPVVLDILARYSQKHSAKLPSLKRVITAGAPAPFEVQENFKKLLSEDAHLYGIYGATETLPIAVIDSNEVLSNTREKSAQGAGVCLGKPVTNSRVRIIPITDEPIAEWHDSLEMKANSIGEITVQGPAVTHEYVARETANRLAKIRDRDGRDIIHRMGDVGYFDETGRLWYCGRKSQRVETKYGTFFTEQIEGIFNAHPRVHRTALVGVDKEPILWIETIQAGLDKEKIKHELIALAKNHPQASLIKTFFFTKKFPTDVRHNSKILREQLTNLANKKTKSIL